MSWSPEHSSLATNSSFSQWWGRANCLIKLRLSNNNNKKKTHRSFGACCLESLNSLSMLLTSNRLKAAKVPLTLAQYSRASLHFDEKSFCFIFFLLRLVKDPIAHCNFQRHCYRWTLGCSVWKPFKKAAPPSWVRHLHSLRQGWWHCEYKDDTGLRHWLEVSRHT